MLPQLIQRPTLKDFGADGTLGLQLGWSVTVLEMALETGLGSEGFGAEGTGYGGRGWLVSSLPMGLEARVVGEFEGTGTAVVGIRVPFVYFTDVAGEEIGLESKGGTVLESAVELAGSVTNGFFPFGDPARHCEVGFAWFWDEVNSEFVRAVGSLGFELGGTGGTVVGGGVSFVDFEDVSLKHGLPELVDGAGGEGTEEFLLGLAGFTAMASF